MKKSENKKDTNIKQILRAIVETYIDTRLPVSSRYIVEKYKLDVCSSTVRNYMFFLHQNGFITRPHSSSGTIPTSKAYRYYIDCLMEKEYLNNQEKQEINLYFNKTKYGYRTIEDIIKISISALSRVVCQMSFASVHKLHYVKVKKIELLCVSPKNILIILVTNTGHVQTSIINTSVDFSEPVLHHISQIITEELSEVPVQSLEDYLLNKILQGEDTIFFILRSAFNLLKEGCMRDINPQFFWEGASFLTDQPEFNSISSLILKKFENQEMSPALLKLIYPADTLIYVGEDVDAMPFSQCSFIASRYRAKKGISGFVGVVGPKRIPYRKIVATISYIAEQLSDRIDKGGFIE